MKLQEEEERTREVKEDGMKKQNDKNRKKI